MNTPTPIFITRGVLFSGLLILLYIISCNYNRSPAAVFHYDEEGYYMYLPATFIYGGFEKVPVFAKEQFTNYPGTNKVFTKYTCGVALMELPFFLTAHVEELAFNKDQATGYTSAYGKAITFGAVLYGLSGLLFMLLALNRKFNFIVSAAAVVFTFLGSNLYYYTICQPGLSHVYSFFLFSVIVYLTPVVLSGGKFRHWLIYGFVFGLIILIRPSNCILLIYPLLYGCFSISAIIERFIFFLHKYKFFLSAVLVGLLVFIPQFIYWKYISGSFVIYSYNKETFIYWNDPKIFKVLFDVQNGWLLYSPIMVLALAGLFRNLKKWGDEALPTIIILILATYIFASWWAWWFGGAFGHRCYVEFYALLSFGMAGFVAMASRNRYTLSLAFMVIVVLIYYNLSLTYLYFPPWDGPNWNWDRFLHEVKQIV